MSFFLPSFFAAFYPLLLLEQVVNVTSSPLDILRANISELSLYNEEITNRTVGLQVKHNFSNRSHGPTLNSLH